MENELVTIATTFDILEAEFLKGQLEAEGFEVYTADDNLIGANFLLANAVGGIKLKVPTEDAEDAMILVEQLRNAEIIEDENFKIDTGWGECPMCESRDIELEKEPNENRKFWLFMFSVPTPKKRKLRCNNCGNIWIDE